MNFECVWVHLYFLEVVMLYRCFLFFSSIFYYIETVFCLCLFKYKFNIIFLITVILVLDNSISWIIFWDILTSIISRELHYFLGHHFLFIELPGVTFYQSYEIWNFLWKIIHIEPLTNTINTILWCIWVKSHARQFYEKEMMSQKIM
jgi:hypothetical protein